MRNTIVITLAAFGAFGAVSTAAPAYADESTYLQQIRQPGKLFIEQYSGGAVTNNQLLRLGYVACEVMRTQIAGGSKISTARSYSDKAVASTMNSMGLPVDRASFMNITSIAEDYLC